MAAKIGQRGQPPGIHNPGSAYSTSICVVCFLYLVISPSVNRLHLPGRVLFVRLLSGNALAGKGSESVNEAITLEGQL